MVFALGMMLGAWSLWTGQAYWKVYREPVLDARALKEAIARDGARRTVVLGTTAA